MINKSHGVLDFLDVRFAHLSLDSVAPEMQSTQTIGVRVKSMAKQYECKNADRIPQEHIVLTACYTIIYRILLFINVCPEFQRPAGAMKFVQHP